MLCLLSNARTGRVEKLAAVLKDQARNAEKMGNTALLYVDLRGRAGGTHLLEGTSSDRRSAGWKLRVLLQGLLRTQDACTMDCVLYPTRTTVVA